MQVHHIGIDLVQALEQFCGISLRVEAHAVMQTCHGAVGEVAGLRSAALLMVAYRVVATAPEDVRVNPALSQLMVKVAHYGTGGTVVKAVELDVAQRASQTFTQSECFVDERVGREPLGLRH